MAYNEQVMAARSHGIATDMLAERTDMKKSEIENLMKTPVDDIIRETELELADEIANSPSKGFDEIVDEINAELDLNQNH